MDNKQQQCKVISARNLISMEAQVNIFLSTKLVFTDQDNHCPVVTQVQSFITTEMNNTALNPGPQTFFHQIIYYS